jgi:hypothetical protein
LGVYISPLAHDWLALPLSPSGRIFEGDHGGFFGVGCLL